MTNITTMTNINRAHSLATSQPLTTDLLISAGYDSPFGYCWQVAPLTEAGIDALDDEHVQCFSDNNAQREAIVFASYNLLIEIIAVAKSRNCHVAFDTQETTDDFQRVRREMIKALVQNTIDSFDARDYEYYVRNSETDHLNSLDDNELLLEYNERFQND